MDNILVQAASDNLPSVDSDMLVNLFVSNNEYISAEIRGAKASRSSKQQYGDAAVGYVQLRRAINLCTVKGRITPEHKIHNKDYEVSVIIDEEREEISSASCSSCAAAAGGCKHSIAFIFWLYRKSEESAPTSVQCYWECSTLSKVGRSTTFIRTAEMSDRKIPVAVPAINNFKDLVMREGCVRHTKGILFDCPPKYLLNMSLYHLALSYKKITDKFNLSNNSYEMFCTSQMSDDSCDEIQNVTKAQSKSSLWNKIRFARITASRIYEVAKCKTVSGSLVESIMGAAMPLKLDAVLRGQRLETEVLAVVGARMDIIYKKCGIFTNKSYPFYEASPDAINDQFVFEVKCPSKDSTVQIYLKDDNLTPKPYSQIQLQMHFTGRKKGIFCVASPNFESNSEVEIVEVTHDKEYCENIIKQSRYYWNSAIFGLLMK